MPRMLALDWDRHEVRYVLATTAGEKLRIRAAGSAPLVDVVEGGGPPQSDLGHSLRAALLEQKVGRPVVLVGVDRSSIELLHFILPPAQDAELPELVLNQAMRESSSITEETVLDFIPLGDDPTRPRRVTAAALAPDELTRIRAACAVAGLKPGALLLRPYAAASLFSRAAASEQSVCLLVNLVADEVDLTVLDEGRVVLFRTVRLPRFADRQQADRRVTAEIRRTLAVAMQGPDGGDPVQAVYVFGGPAEYRELAERIGEELGLPATVCDPFQLVQASSASTPENAAPENAGRFASLLGMLWDQAQGRRHAIDFLHPRRRPRQIGRGQIIAFASAVVAAVVLAAGYFTFNEFAEIDRSNRELAEEWQHLNGLIKGAEKQMAIVSAVRKWQAGDVLWLEEFRELSLRFPPGSDMVIERMSMVGRSRGGVVDVHGVMSDHTIKVRMENRLRDQYHAVRVNRVQESGRGEDYAWHFDASVGVARRDKSQYQGEFSDLAEGGP